MEADDGRRAADPGGEMLDIIWQVVAAGFLAGFDDDDAAGVWHALLAQAAQGRERAKHRVTVVGTAAAVQLVAFEPRDPRPVSLGPADHLRLLVEMAVEQRGVGVRL